MELKINKEDKQKILKLARQSIAEEFQGQPLAKIPDIPLLKRKLGVFVTLHSQGNLRGCIGYISGHQALGDSIKHLAKASAFQDNRFPPLKENELDIIDIEISILSEMEKTTDPLNIKIGTHGIYLKQDWHSGLLLPQVATEQGWDSKTFLQHSCLKAGLPKNSWQDPNTEIFSFTAEIFGEKSLS